MHRQNSFRDVLAVREFRALWAAEIISVWGDQLARVALSVLVFHQTSSAALTALTYALTFIPALFGGILLSGLADRFPRRTVLVISDLVRAGLAALMALPGLPLPALWVLVFALAMASAPFKAAQLALLPDVLHGEQYPVGLAVRTASAQIAQLAGFALGGLVLLVVPPPAALGLNALTFVWSALLVRTGVQARPAASKASGNGEGSAANIVVRSVPLLVLVGLMSLAGLTVAPEGVAAPYASGLGGSALSIGLLLAADPVGSAVGAWIFGHWHSPSARAKAMVPLAVASGLALVPCALRPGLIPSMVLWASSGACSTMLLIQAQALLKDAVPNERRAKVMGLASAVLQVSVGLAVMLAGVLGELIGVYRAVGVMGVITAVAAAALGMAWRHARPRLGIAGQDGHDIGHGMSDAEVRDPGCAFASLPSPMAPIRTKVGRV